MHNSHFFQRIKNILEKVFTPKQYFTNFFLKKKKRNPAYLADNEPIEKSHESKFYYMDKIIEFTLGNEGVVKSDDLETYLINSGNSDNEFGKTFTCWSIQYQNKFSSQQYRLFYNQEKTRETLSIGDLPTDMLLKEVKKTMADQYIIYKKYLTGFLQFFNENPEFSYPFFCYPRTMLSEPFYDYLEEDIKLEKYNTETQTLLYIKLIEKIIFARFLELNKMTKDNIKKGLSKFSKSNNPEIKRILKRTRSKIDSYTGIKCPDHLIYLSTLTETDAYKLAEYTSGRFFEDNSSIETLKLAFLARLSNLLDDSDGIQLRFKDNPYVQNEIAIKYRKRGYITYLYDHLLRNGYLICDNHWKSISDHKYFKSRKANGELEYVTEKQLRQSLSDLKENQNKCTKNNTVDVEFVELKKFLENNFPEQNKSQK